MQPESCQAPYFKYHPSRRNSESSKEAIEATKDPDLGEPLELGPEVTCFLRGLAKNSVGEEKAPSPKPLVKELHRWVTWRAEACETPGWWRELLAVPEVQDCEELAQKVQASFHLPKRVSKLNKMENYHQAPPAPLCLLKKNFLPPPDSIFACQDIREVQREKMVAYAQALQCWAEKTDLPTGGKPHLLAESVKELWEEMKCYLSFSDEEVFKGVTLPEETSANPVKEAEPHSWQPPLRCKLPQRQLGNQLQRGSPLSSPVGRRYCTHPNLWWLWGRCPICQEVWGRGFIIGRWWLPLQKLPPLHKN